VRTPSSLDREKQKERLERARRMTPEERLLAAANLSEEVAMFQKAGARHRRAAARKKQKS
jgi:hypothetical protein